MFCSFVLKQKNQKFKTVNSRLKFFINSKIPETRFAQTAGICLIIFIFFWSRRTINGLLTNQFQNFLTPPIQCQIKEKSF